MKYTEWLYSLTEKQLRALACQCGVIRWRTMGTKDLLNVVAGNTHAESIFQETYGKETSLQK